MNPESEPPDDAMLLRHLRRWVIDVPLPPHFEEQVWQRIAHREAGEQAPRLNLVSRLFELFVVQPRIASAYIALLLVLGLGAGSWAAQRENNRLAATLGHSYVRSIDPYQTQP